MKPSWQFYESLPTELLSTYNEVYWKRIDLEADLEHSIESLVIGGLVLWDRGYYAKV
jgi:hypothetical protein